MKIVGIAMSIWMPQFSQVWMKLLWTFTSGFLQGGGDLRMGIMALASFGFNQWAGLTGLPRGPPGPSGTPPFNPGGFSTMALGAGRVAVEQEAQRSFSDQLTEFLIRSVRAIREDDASARTNREGKTGSGTAVDTDSFEHATWVAVAIDVAVGSIPGVGTVVGIYDAYGILTDADSTTADRVIAVVGVLPGGKIVNVLARTHIVQSGIQAAKRVHGNSRASEAAQHAYEILDTHTGKVVKTGVSGGAKTGSGQSYRGARQAKRWSRDAGDPGRYESTVVYEIPAGPGARSEALRFEAQNAARLRANGHLADLEKHVKP